MSEGDHARFPLAVPARALRLHGLHTGEGTQEPTHGTGPSCRHDPSLHRHPSRTLAANSTSQGLQPMAILQVH